jgi:hypothetical protein
MSKSDPSWSATASATRSGLPRDRARDVLAVSRWIEARTGVFKQEDGSIQVAGAVPGGGGRGLRPERGRGGALVTRALDWTVALCTQLASKLLIKY